MAVIEDIEKKVKEMSEYLTNEAIAEALKITPDAVDAILQGKADIVVQEEADQKGQVVYVNSVKTSYRQKVIAVIRAKGGVGCTVTGMGLAYAISKELKTLLIEVTPEDTTGDLAYYLSFDKYASGLSVPEGIKACMVAVEPNFHVIQLDKNNLVPAVSFAKSNYDAVIIDTPYSMECISMAVKQANTVVAVTSGVETEVYRLTTILNSSQQKDTIKDTILVANNCPVPEVEGFEGLASVKITHDMGLQKAFRRNDLPSLKSEFMKDMNRLKDTVYGEMQKGLLQSLFGG